VTRELAKSRIVQLLNGSLESIDPVDQVLGPSKVPATDFDGIAGLHQVPSESSEQLTSRSISQCVKAPPADEQL